jgi:hypothetical protein
MATPFTCGLYWLNIQTLDEAQFKLHSLSENKIHPIKKLVHNLQFLFETFFI